MKRGRRDKGCGGEEVGWVCSGWGWGGRIEVWVGGLGGGMIKFSQRGERRREEREGEEREECESNWVCVCVLSNDVVCWCYCRVLYMSSECVVFIPSKKNSLKDFYTLLNRYVRPAVGSATRLDTD